MEENLKPSLSQSRHFSSRSPVSLIVLTRSCSCRCGPCPSPTPRLACPFYLFISRQARHRCELARASTINGTQRISVQRDWCALALTQAHYGREPPVPLPRERRARAFFIPWGKEVCSQTIHTIHTEGRKNGLSPKKKNDRISKEEKHAQIVTGSCSGLSRDAGSIGELRRRTGRSMHALRRAVEWSSKALPFVKVARVVCGEKTKIETDFLNGRATCLPYYY